MFSGSSYCLKSTITNLHGILHWNWPTKMKVQQRKESDNTGNEIQMEHKSNHGRNS